MSLKTALITTATLAALVCFAGQDPRLDYSFAAPALDEFEGQLSTATTVGTAKIPNKTVSVSFKNAPVSEFLSWAQKQGVSFVMDETQLKEKRLTLNIDRKPLAEAVDAVAASLGGYWERKGDILVFRRGMSVYGTAVQGLESLPAIPTPPRIALPQGQAGVVPPKVDVNVRTIPTPAVPPASVYQTVPGVALRARSADAIAEKVAKDVERALRESRVHDEKFWDNFAKELEKTLERELKGAPGMQRFDVETYMNSPELKKLRERTLLRGHGTTLLARTVDGEKFLRSLTPAQKDLQKSRGYLRITDLTSEQREMLGIKDGDDVTYEFVIKGERVKVQK